MTTSARQRLRQPIRAAELLMPSWVDVSLYALQIGSNPADMVQLHSAIIAADVKRTYEGASVIDVTFDDENGTLENAPALQHGTPAKLNGNNYRLVNTRKRGRQFDVQFEDEAVWQLRRMKGARKSSQGTLTRVQFAKLLVDEVPGLVFVTKDLYAQQQIWTPPTSSTTPTQQENASAGQSGFPPNVSFTIKGKKADREQVRILWRALLVSERYRTPRKAKLALIEALIVESTCRNLTYGDSSSVGCLQLLDIHGSEAKRLNVEWVVDRFLRYGFTGAGGAIALADAHPSWKPGRVAQTVQGSAFPDRYEQQRAEADAILSAWTGGDAGNAPTAEEQRQETRATAYERKVKEDSWTCLLRLAEEVKWRCFAQSKVVYFFKDYDLLTSRPVLTIREDMPSVIDLDYDVDASNRVPDEATVKLVGERWILPPGTVVVVEDAGVANGRWLVKSTSRSLIDQIVTLELARPAAQKLEGTPTSSSSSSSSGDTTAAAGLNTVQATGDWAGTKAVFDSFVTPFMRRRGLKPGSQKRTPSGNAGAGGSNTSDHLTTSTNAYATDYPTTDGKAAAKALASTLGFPSWKPNDYTTFNVTIDGKKFRVQILWGSEIDHDDHIHVGIRRL